MPEELLKEISDPDIVYVPDIKDIYIPSPSSFIVNFVKKVSPAFAIKAISLQFSNDEYIFDFAAFEALSQQTLKIVATATQDQIKNYVDDKNLQRFNEFTKNAEEVPVSHDKNFSARLIKRAIFMKSARRKPDIQLFPLSEVGRIHPNIKKLIKTNMNYVAGLPVFVRGKPVGVLWGIRKTILEQTQLKEMVWQFHALFDSLENILDQEISRDADVTFTRRLIEKTDTRSQVFRIYYTERKGQSLPVKSTIAHSYPHEATYRVDTSYIVPTADGYNVSLKHFIPEEMNDSPYVVLMIPGFFCNRSFFERMAKVMALTHGYSTFTMDLRGRSKYTLPKNRSIKDGWTIDDYIWHDFPAALSFIKRKCKGKKIIVMGHSMGGMISKFYVSSYYSMLRTGEYKRLPNPEKYIAGIVSITSPSYIDLETGLPFVEHAKSILRKIGSSMAGDMAVKLLTAGIISPFATINLNRFFNFINGLSGSMRMFSFNVGQTPTLKDFIGYEQMTAQEWYFFMENVFCEESVKVVLQFARSQVNKNSFLSFDGKINYTEEQANLKLPLFSVIGTRDKIAPPDTIEYGLQFVDDSILKKSYYDQGHMGIAFHPETIRSICKEVVEWSNDFNK